MMDRQCWVSLSVFVTLFLNLNNFLSEASSWRDLLIRIADLDALANAVPDGPSRKAVSPLISHSSSRRDWSHLRACLLARSWLQK